MTPQISSEPRVVLSETTLDNQPVIRIDFQFNKELLEFLKSRTTARWSGSLRSWYLPVHVFDLRAFYGTLTDIAFIDYSALKKKPPASKPVEDRKPAAP